MRRQDAREILSGWHRAKEIPKHTRFSVLGDSVANARLTSIVWFLRHHLGETIALQTGPASLINIFVYAPESRIQLLLLFPGEEKPREMRLPFKFPTTSEAHLEPCGENVAAERFEGSRNTRDAASRHWSAIFEFMKPMR